MTGRDRIALTVVVALAAIGAYWFLLLAPKREEASKQKAKVAAVQRKLDDAQRLLDASLAARSTYATNYTAVARLGKAVPPDDDVASLLTQLDSAAKSTGSDFRTIKLTGARSGAPAPAPSAAPATPPPSNGAKPAPASNPAPAAPAQAATAILPPGAVVGPAGLGTLPFDFEFQGSFFRLADFMGRVQRYVTLTKGNSRLGVSGRLMTIDGIGVAFSEKGYPEMEARLTATAYLLPPTEGLTNGATPSAPAQGGAQTVAAQGPGVPTTPATVVSP